jgi:hypothetical protein
MAVFSEAFARLREDFDEARGNRHRLMGEIRSGIRQRAEETGREIAEQSRSRKTEFAAMLGGIRSRLNEQAEQTRERLSALARDLRQGGAVFTRRHAPR